MKANKANSRIYFKTGYYSIAIGANKGYTQTIENLHDLVDNINIEDGIKTKVTKIAFHLRNFLESGSNIFAYQPLVVQTAGTWTSNVNNSGRTYDVALATDIDDLFGYDTIGNQRISKVIPSGDGTLAALCIRDDTTVILSQKHLEILNKEVESERLQDLIFGVVGASQNQDTLFIYYAVEIIFQEVRQKVVIR